jgi:hypothetical protein
VPHLICCFTQEHIASRYRVALIQSKPITEYPRALVKAIQPLHAYVSGQDADKLAVLCAYPALETDHYTIQAQAFKIMADV